MGWSGGREVCGAVCQVSRRRVSSSRSPLAGHLVWLVLRRGGRTSHQVRTLSPSLSLSLSLVLISLLRHTSCSYCLCLSFPSYVHVLPFSLFPASLVPPSSLSSLFFLLSPSSPHIPLLYLLYLSRYLSFSLLCLLYKSVSSSRSQVIALLRQFPHCWLKWTRFKTKYNERL